MIAVIFEVQIATSLLIIKVSLYFLSIRKFCIEYPIKILRLARSGVIKFLTRI